MEGLESDGAGRTSTWFRFHLATLLVAVLATAGFMLLQFQERITVEERFLEIFPVEEYVVQGWPVPVRKRHTARSLDEEIAWHRMKGHLTPEREAEARTNLAQWVWSPWAILPNTVVGVVALLGVSSVVEILQRRRDATR